MALSNDSPLNAVIVRLSGEIPIKSEAVRSIWERKLYLRIANRVKDNGVVEKRWGYIFIRTQKPLNLITLLKPIFGISALIPARICESDLETIKDAALSVAKHYYSSLVRKGLTPKSFAIISRKVVSKEFGTTEIRYDVGRYIKEKLRLSVNLENPDIPIHIEVREKEAFIYTSIYRTAGGLPIGVQSRVIVLTRLDLESIASLWLLMKRGCPITSIHFDLCGDTNLIKKLNMLVSQIFNKSCEGMCKLRIISIKAQLEKVMSIVPQEYAWYILLKYMVHLAEEITNEEKARGIAIGLRSSLNTDTLRLLKWLKTDTITLHYPVLNYDDRELSGLINKIGSLLDIDTLQLNEECAIIRELKANRASVNVELLNHYWRIFMREISLPHLS